MDYKRLVSSAPATSILNAQAFRYTGSLATDIRKTFARLQRADRQRPVSMANNVHPLPRKAGDASMRTQGSSA